MYLLLLVVLRRFNPEVVERPGWLEASCRRSFLQHTVDTTTYRCSSGVLCRCLLVLLLLRQRKHFGVFRSFPYFYTWFCLGHASLVPLTYGTLVRWQGYGNEQEKKATTINRNQTCQEPCHKRGKTRAIKGVGPSVLHWSLVTWCQSRHVSRESCCLSRGEKTVSRHVWSKWSLLSVRLTWGCSSVMPSFYLSFSGLMSRFGFGDKLTRGTIINRTYGTHQNLYMFRYFC